MASKEYLEDLSKRYHSGKLPAAEYWDIMNKLQTKVHPDPYGIEDSKEWMMSPAGAKFLQWWRYDDASANIPHGTTQWLRAVQAWRAAVEYEKLPGE